VDQHRIDEQQAGHCQSQDPRPGHLPPAEGGAGRHSGHRRGPQNRGLETGEQGEEAEDSEHSEHAGGETEAAEDDPGHDEHEGDVLARHRQQVTESGGPEVVGRGRRLTPVVTEEDPGEQRRGLVAQRGGAPDHRPTQRVGQATHGVPGLDRTRVIDRQATGYVADRQVGPVGHRDHPARDDDPLPRQCLGQVRRRHLVGHLDLQTPAVEVDDGSERPVVHLRIGHEHDGPVGDRRRPGWLQAGPRPVPEGCGQQQAAEAEERGRPEGEGDHDQGRAEGGRHRP